MASRRSNSPLKPLLLEQQSGTALAVTVRRHARARRLRLRVSPAGEVDLLLPRGCSRAEGLAFLEANRAWIEGRLAAVEPLQIPDSIELTAIGRHWPVVRHSGAGCREQADHLLLGDAPDAWQPALVRWLQRTARRELEPLLSTLSAELGLPYGQLTVRGQRSRWGSCSGTGNISLNRALLFLEPALVRYVLVHELCHTVHHDHSPRFWQLVARCEPDWQRLDRALRRAMSRVPRWAL